MRAPHIVMRTPIHPKHIISITHEDFLIMKWIFPSVAKSLKKKLPPLKIHVASWLTPFEILHLSYSPTIEANEIFI